MSWATAARLTARSKEVYVFFRFDDIMEISEFDLSIKRPDMNKLEEITNMTMKELV